MKIAMNHPIIVWSFITVLLMPLGCAHQPILPPPPSEDIRAKLGTIGVVGARFDPEKKFETPAKGRMAGAGRGTAGGALAGASLGALGVLCPPFAAGPCVIVIGAVGGVIGTIPGAIYGAATALPAATVEEAETTLKTALADLKVQEATRDHVFKIAQDQTHYHFVLLTDQGPTSPEAEASYDSLAEKGINTILEVGLVTIGWEGKWTLRSINSNSPVSLSITAHARLIGIANGTVLYDHVFVYRSEERKFTEWASNNAQLFREGFDQGYQNLAVQIVDQLFLAHHETP